MLSNYIWGERKETLPSILTPVIGDRNFEISDADQTVNNNPRRFTTLK